MLAQFEVSLRILTYASNVPNSGKLQWIVSEASFITSDVYEDLPYMPGVIGITQYARNIAEFEDHWVRIDMDAQSTHPWLRELYMTSNE